MKLGIEEMYLNIIKAIYDKPVAITILNGEKLKPFPLKSRAKNETRVTIFSTLIQCSPGIPSQINKTGRRNTWNSNRQGRSKLTLFADDIILA
jgi:hypothetical protein